MIHRRCSSSSWGPRKPSSVLLAPEQPVGGPRTDLPAEQIGEVVPCDRARQAGKQDERARELSLCGEHRAGDDQRLTRDHREPGVEPDEAEDDRVLTADAVTRFWRKSNISTRPRSDSGARGRARLSATGGILAGTGETPGERRFIDGTTEDKSAGPSGAVGRGPDPLLWLPSDWSGAGRSPPDPRRAAGVRVKQAKAFRSSGR